MVAPPVLLWVEIKYKISNFLGIIKLKKKTQEAKQMTYYFEIRTERNLNSFLFNIHNFIKTNCVSRESNPDQLLGRQLCWPLYHWRLVIITSKNKIQEFFWQISFLDSEKMEICMIYQFQAEKWFWCSMTISQAFCAPSIFHLWKLGFGFPDPGVPNYCLIWGWDAGYFAPISSKAFD